MSVSGTDRTRLLWAIALFSFVFAEAIALQARGALLASFQTSFGVSEGQLGLVAPAGTIGFVAAVLAAGVVMGRIDIGRYLFVGALGTAACLVLVGVAPTYLLLLLLLVVQGTMAGVFRGLDRPVLSHLFPSRRGQVFNLYSVAWALGAVAGPLLVNAILVVGDWRLAYVFFGLLFVPIVLLVRSLSVSSPVGTDEQSLALADFSELLRDPTLIAVILVLVLVGGVEGGLYTWLPYYANQFLPREHSNVILSALLVAYIPGRLFVTATVERVGYLPISSVFALCCVPALFLLLEATTFRGMLVGVLLVGFFLSGLFPTISAFGVDRDPAHSGPINAVTTVAMYVGLAGVPIVIGVIAEVESIRVGIALVVPMMVGACLVTVLTWFAVD